MILGANPSRSWWSGLAILAVLCGLAAHARAQASSETAASKSPVDERASLGLVLGGKVGGGIGKPFSDFGATPTFELEVGYLLPLSAPIGRSIELFVSGQYAQPGLDGHSKTADPRLPGNGIVSYDITQQELTLTLGALYRFDVGLDLLMPYAGVGGRLYMLDTQAKATGGGQAYGKNEETQSAGGLLLLGGVDFFLGPGALLAELSFGWASLDAFVLRDTNLGALSLAVGYRFML